MDDIKREIAIMKKVHHPNVLRLYEVMDDPKVTALAPMLSTRWKRYYLSDKVHDLLLHAPEHHSSYSGIELQPGDTDISGMQTAGEAGSGRFVHRPKKCSSSRWT